MKRKVFVFCSTILLVFTLSGCTALSQEDLDLVQQEVDSIVVYDDTSIKAQLAVIEASLTTLESEAYNDEALQEKITALQTNFTALLASVETMNETLSASQETEMLVRLISIEATLLTLATDISTSQTDISTLTEQVNSMSNSSEESNYDYIYDVDGNYITGKELLDLLSYKYFGVINSDDDFGGCNPVCYGISSDIFFGQEFNETMDANDFFARYVLFLEELRMYEFYYEHRSGISLNFHTNENEYYEYFYFDISTTTLLNTGFDTSVHEIMNKMFDIRFNSEGPFTEADIQNAYDAYVAAETYAGTVLDIN